MQGCATVLWRSVWTNDTITIIRFFTVQKRRIRLWTCFFCRFSVLILVVDYKTFVLTLDLIPDHSLCMWFEFFASSVKFTNQYRIARSICISICTGYLLLFSLKTRHPTDGKILTHQTRLKNQFIQYCKR